MKFLKTISAFVLLLVVFISCQNQKKVTNTSSSDTIYQKWMIVEYNNLDKSEIKKLNAYIDFSKNSENPNFYSAFAGCNRINFMAKFPKANKIEISKPMMTLMFCADAMQLENAMGKDLDKITNYKIDGHFLTLSDDKGTVNVKLVAEAWD